MDQRAVVPTQDINGRKLSQKLSFPNPFKRKEEVRKLTDPQFDKKINETNRLAEELNNNFAANYKKVKEEINIIHKNVMRRLKKDTGMSNQAKTYYDNVCRTYTYCNANAYTKVGNRETYRKNFEQAVQDYLKFVQGNNIKNQGKVRAMQKMLDQIKDLPSDEKQRIAKLLARELKTKALDEKIEVPIIENYEGKRFLIIFTGGTIGSVTSADGKIDQPGQGSDVTAAKLLLGEIHKKYGDNIDFDTDESLEVTLSENLTSSKKLKLVKNIIQILKDKGSTYDGIFITNGSDTLAYTISLESMVLPKIKNKESGAPVPIFVVSANKPLDDPKSNGLENLKLAVDTCVSVKDLPSTVFTIENWKVKGQGDVVYGSRATQCKPVRDTYGSLSGDPESSTVSTRSFARIADGKITILDIPLHKKLQERALQERASVDEVSESPGSLTNRFLKLETLTNRVYSMKEPFSGLNYETFDLTKCDFFVQGCFHGGTVCAEGEEENFLNFIQKCKAAGVQVILGPLYGPENRKLYGSTAKIDDVGIPIVLNITHETLTEKARLALSLWPANKQDPVGEVGRQKERMKFILDDVSYEWLLPGKMYKKGTDGAGAESGRITEIVEL